MLINTTMTARLKGLEMCQRDDTVASIIIMVPNDHTIQFLTRATKSIKDTGITVSKSIYSKTKEGLTMLMQSQAMSNIKGKFRDFMSPDDEEKDNNSNDFNRTFADDRTAATNQHGRRQSMVYSNKRVSAFYMD
jgi:hypothetical protein